MTTTDIKNTRNPGAIVLVAGPSGAGKDTIIAYARTLLAHDPQFVFARRLITRQATDDIEAFERCSEENFKAAEAAGCLALSWCAHGTAYGVRNTELRGVDIGRIVVVNVSRRVIPSGVALAQCAMVVHLTASPDVLARRLKQRGRDSEADVASRLARDVPLPEFEAPLVTIINDGSIAQAGNAFIKALLALADTLQKRQAGNDAEPRT